MILRALRAGVKLAALTFWSALFLLPGALEVFFRRRIELGALFTRWWARGALRILGGRVEVAGNALPERGGLVVSNHVSYLDIMVHASLFEVRFAPKIEMKKWPLMGWLTAFSNPVWIDRRRRSDAGNAKRAMCAAFEGPVPLLVYPEGTSSDGKALLPFKTTCFAAALEAGAWITPMLIRYDVPADGTVLPYFGNAAFLPHIWRVMGLKEFRCQVYIMEKFHPERSDRGQLAAGLRDAMEDRYRRWCENA